MRHHRLHHLIKLLEVMTGPRLGKLEKELVCKAVKQAVALQVGLEVGVVVERVWKIVRQ